MNLSGYTQQKSIDSKLLQNILEETFRKDTLILKLEDIIKKQDTLLINYKKVSTLSNKQLNNQLLIDSLLKEKNKVLIITNNSLLLNNKINKSIIFEKDKKIKNLAIKLKISNVLIPISIITTYFLLKL